MFTPFANECSGLLNDELIHTGPVYGDYVGKTVPSTIANFRKDLENILATYNPNGWNPVDFTVAKALITFYTVQFSNLVAGWRAALPANDASPELLAWYKATN
jgi:hypothetical protein